MIRELAITALAAGGDGVGRDDEGRVTFVPGTAPGDRVRARIVKATASYARAELVDIVAPSPARVAPPCPHFVAGCGGCRWQHVARAEQLAAKQAIVAGALRRQAGLRIHPIADPCPPLHWRRRARFHVAGGVVGLYAAASHRLVTIDACPQLEPALDAALGAAIAARPPDGELALVIGHRGEVAIASERPWPAGAALVGTAGIVGVLAGDTPYGTPEVELEPGLAGGPWDFAQASAAGNRALVECVLASVGRGPGRLLELHAGSGNFTRGLVAAGWDVVATDHVAKPGLVVGSVAEVLAEIEGPFDALVLDPPRTGAADAIAGIRRLAPPAITYISCDPQTLARDLDALPGYLACDAWPIDVMPQTAHVEVVVRLARA
jgi:23S rRNA (uracil1939-C5)-methyltransferase